MFARAYQSGESPFSPEELDVFAALAQSKIHPKARSTILGEGDKTDFCLLIESGLVKVVSEGRSDKGPQFAGLRGPGDLVGEMAAIFEEPRTASIIALTDVEALWIPGSRFRDYCKRHPEIVLTLWWIDKERQKEEKSRSSESSISKEQRFAQLLIYLVAKGHRMQTEDGIVIKSPQKELAEFMNLSRESISPIVRGLKNSNVIQVVRGKTVIRDWNLLERIADGDYTTAP
jgi:CRP/FNR family transcriptional regulator, cyclic AMP receptor protein